MRALLLVLALGFGIWGCKSGSRSMEEGLPMPPSAESGVYDGQYIQTEYGFGIPLPPKWSWIRLSAEQEVDEVARITDPHRDLLVRLTVQDRSGDDRLTGKAWAQMAAQDLEDHLFKIEKKGKVEDWKTTGGERWFSASFQVTDTHDRHWAVQEWALERNDLWYGAHGMMLASDAAKDAGKKLFKEMQGALTQIHWYTPIGPRGISIERFELAQFTEDFRAALESRSLVKVNGYLDELFPDRSKWNAWYQQLVSGEPKSFEIKAVSNGLVINGDYAAASWTITRHDLKDDKTEKFEKSFRLSKKEGAWKITSSIERK
ncbi:MAG TPA: hypothetical protein VHE12_01610 [bacterium]|nr:hypothetical protein [bacterium]